MMRFAALALMALTACAAPQAPSGPDQAPTRIQFPPMQSFPGRSPGPAQRANADIARDFLTLSFQLESGRPLPALTRFEGPITVRVAGNVAETTRNDLDKLLARLRDEARLDIRLTNSPDANIVVQSVPNRDLRSIAPNAACFVVPRVQTWPELRAARGTGTLDWGTLDRRDRAAIFVPSDSTPQETRDCLHEELAQALGPLNDVYYLPDSVFNDDNIHAVLTGFDMLILRAYYDPSLANGMSREAVAARLPAILARINPRGEGIPSRPVAPTAPQWSRTIERALVEGTTPRARRAAALQAIAIGESLGYDGPRAGFAQYALGRLLTRDDPQGALTAFNRASRIYAASPETDIHRAFIAIQLAAFTLLNGDAEQTIAITSAAIPVARRHENAALLSLLMMFQAEALDLSGQTEEGMRLRLDSLGWALYGFGDRQEVIDRLNEIAALPPRDEQS